MLSYENKDSTCCFTGHRPQKLHQEAEEVREGLEKAVKQAYEEGYRFFITGMAMGVDLWAGEAVLKLKEQALLQYWNYRASVKVRLPDSSA